MNPQCTGWTEPRDGVSTRATQLANWTCPSGELRRIGRRSRSVNNLEWRFACVYLWVQWFSIDLSFIITFVTFSSSSSSFSERRRRCYRLVDTYWSLSEVRVEFNCKETVLGMRKSPHWRSPVAWIPSSRMYKSLKLRNRENAPELLALETPSVVRSSETHWFRIRYLEWCRRPTSQLLSNWAGSHRDHWSSTINSVTEIMPWCFAPVSEVFSL